MKKNLNQLAIVVLYWNDSKKTIKCLKSLFQQKKQKFNIILVDNNSDQKYSKEILDWIKKKNFNYTKVKKNFIPKKNNNKINLFYIKNRINYGCGLGHNAGYEFCLKNNYDFIARIDNDMVAPNNLIFQLVQRLEKNKFIAAISPKVMFANYPKIIWFGGTKIGNNLPFIGGYLNSISF